MAEFTCNIVDESGKPVYHALVIVDGHANQLVGDSFKITKGDHQLKVIHKKFLTEQGAHDVQKDFRIVLGGDPHSLLR
jgi:hypothetical protein